MSIEQTKSRASSAAALPPLFRRLLLLIGGICLLTLSSYIVIPMVPVPITMQTLAVTAIGALYGWRLGMLTVMFWLTLGALGLPVFAGGASGIEHLLGPTAGYLIAFPIAAAATGQLVARGWNADRLALGYGAMLIGNLACLSIGALWLSTHIGFIAAAKAGFAPFIVGALIKSGLGFVVLRMAAYGGHRGVTNDTNGLIRTNDPARLV